MVFKAVALLIIMAAVLAVVALYKRGRAAQHDDCAEAAQSPTRSEQPPH